MSGGVLKGSSSIIPPEASQYNSNHLMKTSSLHVSIRRAEISAARAAQAARRHNRGRSDRTSSKLRGSKLGTAAGQDKKGIEATGQKFTQPIDRSRLPRSNHLGLSAHLKPSHNCTDLTDLTASLRVLPVSPACRHVFESQT